MVPMSCSAGIHCVLRMCIDNNHALLSPDVDEYFQQIFPNVFGKSFTVYRTFTQLYSFYEANGGLPRLFF